VDPALFKILKEKTNQFKLELDWDQDVDNRSSSSTVGGHPFSSSFGKNSAWFRVGFLYDPTIASL